MKLYFEEFGLIYSNIKKGVGRKSSCKETTNIFEEFIPTREIVNCLISDIGPINLDTSEFILVAAKVKSLRNISEAMGSKKSPPLCCGQNI